MNENLPIPLNSSTAESKTARRGLRALLNHLRPHLKEQHEGKEEREKEEKMYARMGEIAAKMDPLLKEHGINIDSERFWEENGEERMWQSTQTFIIVSNGDRRYLISRSTHENDELQNSRSFNFEDAENRSFGDIYRWGTREIKILTWSDPRPGIEGGSIRHEPRTINAWINNNHSAQRPHNMDYDEIMAFLNEIDNAEYDMPYTGERYAMIKFGNSEDSLVEHMKQFVTSVTWADQNYPKNILSGDKN